MDTSFEFKGVWWDSENPEKHCSGTLYYTPDNGTHLDIIGGLRKEASERSDYQLLLGMTTTGKKITLMNCFVVNNSFGCLGIESTRYLVNVCFVGAHFSSTEKIIFNNMYFRVLNLDEWVWKDGFEIKLDDESYTIKYKRPNKKEFIVGNLKIGLYFNQIGPKRCMVQKDISIQQKIYIRISFPNGVNFEEFLKVIDHLNNFITLALDKPTKVIELSGNTECNKQIIAGREHYPEVDIYYNRRNSCKYKDGILPTNMLFNYLQIENNFEDYLNNWFNKREVLEPVLNLYFGVIYDENMYLDQRFLNIIQAIEAYHRRTQNNKELSDDEHIKRFAAVMDTIPDEYKEWVSGRLQYGNEPVLRKRLKELFLQIKDVVEVSNNDIKSLINKLCITRNYLTHYDKSLEEQALNGLPLYDVIELLKRLLKFHILKEIGFKKEDIKKMNNTINYLKW